MTMLERGWATNKRIRQSSVADSLLHESACRALDRRGGGDHNRPIITGRSVVGSGNCPVFASFLVPISKWTTRSNNYDQSANNKPSGNDLKVFWRCLAEE